ncbi:hypothetical protein [Arthrobacter sp. ISL-72]|uniref:hypothetical protein n=1 Tax=Arthrobacter sp. ISL-72 TaxID=2819114 RepID=UPI0037BE9A86
MVDDSRLIHDFHRGGRVPPGLRSYLMQQQWLYVATFATGAHGFRITALSGTIAVAALDGTELEFVVNLGELKARTVELGNHGSEVPPVQESLF